MLYRRQIDINFKSRTMQSRLPMYQVSRLDTIIRWSSDQH